MTSGRLLVVATPIGNLDDMTPRAVEALRSAAVILCEDTRHTRKLLTHFRIETPLERFDEHTEDEKAAQFIHRVAGGEIIALVSDAGMPLLSDPGFRIVRMAREHGLTIEPLPGPFAAALALVASGIAPQPFTFFGFTPHREGERRDFYRRVAAVAHTAIVYESPERLLASLDDALAILGDIEVTVGREMTKMHEEFVNGTISSVLEALRARDSIRGEITIVFGAAEREAEEVPPERVREEFERLRATGMRRNDAVKVIAEKFGMRRNDVYRLLL